MKLLLFPLRVVVGVAIGSFICHALRALSTTAQIQLDYEKIA